MEAQLNAAVWAFYWTALLAHLVLGAGETWRRVRGLPHPATYHRNWMISVAALVVATVSAIAWSCVRRSWASN